MAHITTLTRAYNDLHNSQANTYSYSGSFETFKESEVKVTKNDSDVITTLTYNSSPSDNTQYSVNLTDKTIHVGGANLTSGTLSIFPETDLGDPTLKAPYTAGSAITASDLTNNQKQVLRKLMEHEEKKLDNNGGTMTGDLTLGEDVKIIFEGATDNAHETTITVADPTSDKTITFPDTTGTVVTTGDTGTVTSTMITNDTIVNADVNSSAAIAGTKIDPHFGSQNVTTTGGLGIGGDSALTGNLDVDGLTTLDGATIDNIQIGITNDNEIDTLSGNLTIDSAGGTTTIDDALDVTGALGVTGTSTLSNVTGGAVVTSGTSTSDTKVYSAKRTGEIFYGKDTVEEIQSGETWSSADNKVATTAAIDARIIDLVDDVGGFVPIANELSFPNANPDVNNGAGTLVSIKALSTAYTSNSSGEITINNGTVGNSTVTITGAGNAVTYAQTLGIIVETTSTLNTYAFHRQTPDATSTTAVANNATNINTVAGISGNVTTVAGISADVTTVAGKITEVGRLGTAAAVEDMSILGTAAIVEDMSILGTTDVVADMAILGTTDVVADMAILGTTDVVADLNTLGTAAIVTDMDALADVATEIGRLGTADAVADMNTLGTADIVSDMNDLATSGNITAMSNCSGSITSINTAASNLTSINNFGDKYQIAASDPSTDGGGNALAEGDLYFNTTADELKVYNGSAWQGGVTASGNFATTTGNTFTGANTYNDNVKAQFGTDVDLSIYHNNGDGYIENTDGSLKIINSTDGWTYLQPVSGSNGIVLKPNNASLIYYNGNLKLETTNTGVGVTGDITATGNLTLTSTSPTITFTDSDTNPDYTLYAANGNFNIYDATNAATRFLINSDGHIDISGNVDFASGIDVTGNITVSGTVDGVDVAALNTTVSNLNADKIEEGDSKVEVVDTGSATYVSTVVDNVEANRTLSSKATIFDSAYFGSQLDKTDGTGQGIGIHYGGGTSNVGIISSTNTSGLQIRNNAAVSIQQNGFPNNVYATFSNTGGSFSTSGTGRFDYDGTNINFALNVLPDTDSNYDIGTSAKRFANIYGDTIYGDGSNLTNVNATTLDSIDSASFLRSDANDTTTGNLTLGSNSDEKLALQGSSSPYIRFKEGTTNKAYIQWNPNGSLYIVNDESSEHLRIASGSTGLIFYDGSDRTVWTSGNDGSGSGLDSDLLDGQHGSYYTNAANLTGTLPAIDGSNLTGLSGTTINGNTDHQVMTGTGTANTLQGEATFTHNPSTFDTIISHSGNTPADLIIRNTHNSFTGAVARLSIQAGDNSNVGGMLELECNGQYHGIESRKNGYLYISDNGTTKLMLDNTGNLLPGADNTLDLGASGSRWRNIYTGDLNLSNEGSSNDVDSTWGNWTIQEGESDLFLKNNRSGKKYKFNLTEVS